MSSAAQTYATYLQLDKLLDAQAPQSTGPEHDELLFIIIHQVYELWFKQLLHEGDYLADLLLNNDRATALHTLRRMLTILKTVVGQIDVLETMTPLEFNSFRSYLETASGFQSAQFREMEFVMGYKREAMLEYFPPDSPGRIALQKRFNAPTLWDAFLAYLAQNGYQLPAAILSRDVTQSVQPSPEIQEILIKIYRQEPATARICERLIDMDEGIQEWRYRHVKMVERTIGNKQGTGGSSGVQYLASTLMKPFFPDLWAIRTYL